MYWQHEQEQEVIVGTPSWFAWLETASTFSFVCDEGHFTARKERSGQQRGGWYWKAYRKRDGKLFSRYLGKSEALTLERLRAIAAALSGTSGAIAHPDDGVSPIFSSSTAGDLHDAWLSVRLHPPRLPMSLVSRPQLVYRLQEGA